jgi:hypothetical protein
MIMMIKTMMMMMMMMMMIAGRISNPGQGSQARPFVSNLKQSTVDGSFG